MPALKIYDLFLSHVWRSSQNGEYYRLARLLENTTYLRWRNYSVPQHDPLGTKTDAQLRRALDRQIARVNCFLVIAGMYVNHRKWIQQELEIAERYAKPVIAVSPWGQQRISLAVQSAAKEIVGWRAASVVAAVRRWSL